MTPNQIPAPLEGSPRRGGLFQLRGCGDFSSKLERHKMPEIEIAPVGGSTEPLPETDVIQEEKPVEEKPADAPAGDQKADIDWANVDLNTIPDDVKERFRHELRPGFVRQLSEKEQRIQDLEKELQTVMNSRSPETQAAPGSVPPHLAAVGVTPQNYRVDEDGDAAVFYEGQWYQAVSIYPTLKVESSAKRIESKLQALENREAEREAAKQKADIQSAMLKAEKAGEADVARVFESLKIDPAQAEVESDWAQKHAWEALIEEFGDWRKVSDADRARVMERFVKQALVKTGRLDAKQLEKNDKAKQDAVLPSGGSIADNVNKPVSEMTPDEQVAYARQRARDYTRK